MADLFDNPAGLDGFEFIEFSAPEKGILEPVFETMGFTKIARHRGKDVALWRQGGINLITNYAPKSAAWYFAREHGPAACGMPEALVATSARGRKDGRGFYAYDAFGARLSAIPPAGTLPPCV